MKIKYTDKPKINCKLCLLPGLPRKISLKLSSLGCYFDKLSELCFGGPFIFCLKKDVYTYVFLQIYITFVATVFCTCISPSD